MNTYHINISARTINDYNRYIIELMSMNDVRIGLYIIDYTMNCNPQLQFPFMQLQSN